MKFKNKIDKKNIIFISLVGVVGLLTFCGMIYLNAYIYAIAFLLLVIFLLGIYIDTSYELAKEYFIVKYSFIKMKYKYEKITKIEILDKKLMIKIGKFDFIINVEKPEKIKKELEKRVSKK